KLRVQMRAEISGLHHRLQATMIYVTHDQVEALTMADKIVVMKLGVIQQIGGPLELYNNPDNKFVAGFIGSPPMNFMVCNVMVEDDDVYIHEGDFRLKVTPAQAKLLKPYAGKQVTFGIRPEDVSYEKESIDGQTIDGTISVVEPLGAETHVFVATSKNQITGKIDPSVVVKVGEKVSLAPNMKKAKFFDLQTELAIR
ncbi:MAG: ABC transporter ATP-binding protein, partial [Spirochaetales bacterium]|nr:ABC transporter ATP-binding protein [Spirochaetales bacterium]